LRGWDVYRNLRWCAWVETPCQGLKIFCFEREWRVLDSYAMYEQIRPLVWRRNFVHC
jgi:hypothetical protein